jgi:formate hydrogenlyase subunit 3/multisubunit Na+/H+ antiporter MnhD subunit
LIGTPVFPVFLAKWNIMGVLAGKSILLLALLLLGMLLAAVGVVYFFIRVFGQQPGGDITPYHTSSGMKLSVVLTLISIIIIGIYMPSGLAQILSGIVADLGF